MIDSLKVILWGEEIGRLSWDKRRKTSYFNFNPEYLPHAREISPLMAPVKGSNPLMPVWGESEQIYQKLPAFLSDSLPDSWGNQLFELWRKQQHLANSDITPLDKLSFIGKRGMGALEFIPDVKIGKRIGKFEIGSLIDLAHRIFLDRENAVIHPEESLTMQSLIAVGTSAGGRQPKAILAINRETGEITSGQVAGQDGCDYCILKFGDPSRSSAELEMAYYRMACAAGIPMMKSELREIEGQRHFLTMRYDRKESEKLHTQSLAAIWPEADSYEQLLSVCRRIHLPESDCQDVFRRMVFNHLANNTDDHNKNFAFIMSQEGEWRLAPAFDMNYIFDMGGFLPNRDHCLFAAGKLYGLTMQDALDIARNEGIRRPESIIRSVAEAVFRFREFAEAEGVAEEWIGRVETTLNEHLADWGLASGRCSLSYTEEGYMIENARIEAAYKGNYHLFADIDGKARKFILRTGTPDHDDITRKGLSNLSEDDFQVLVRKYLLPKA